MTLFQNGRIPAPGTPGSPLVRIPGGSGTDSNGPWEFWISPHTLALWMAAKAYAEKHFGRTLHIRTGWNCYRPYDVQAAARKRACAAGNCNAAASPGYSSHGGTWIDSHFTGGRWVDAMAIDVDPNGLTWAQVWEACSAAGFLCNAITIARAGIAEPWHIIDLHPWDAVPADNGGSHPFDPPIDPPVIVPPIIPIGDSNMFLFYDSQAATAANLAEKDIQYLLATYDGGQLRARFLVNGSAERAVVLAARGSDPEKYRIPVAACDTITFNKFLEAAGYKWDDATQRQIIPLLDVNAENAGGGTVDQAAVEKAAHDGAQEAISALVLKPAAS